MVLAAIAAPARTKTAPTAEFPKTDFENRIVQGTPDPRPPAMERVLHVAAGESQRIYPFGAFAGEPVINDEVGGEHFAFAWLAFHPDAGVYGVAAPR